LVGGEDGKRGRDGDSSVREEFQTAWRRRKEDPFFTKSKDGTIGKGLSFSPLSWGEELPYRKSAFLMVALAQHEQPPWLKKVHYGKDAVGGGRRLFQNSDRNSGGLPGKTLGGRKALIGCC